MPFSDVAPFAGAWIEIFIEVVLPNGARVAPFAGAWIEIFCALFINPPI